MADSTKNKGKKTLDAFADDLDAMLSMDATPASQQVGVIDDDDAIDRLLMGDNFSHSESDTEHDEFADIDALIGDEVGGGRKVPVEIDEFGDDIDDMIANIQIKPQRQTEPVIEALDEFADSITGAEFVHDIDEPKIPELTALQTVGEIDEFGDDYVEQIVPAEFKLDSPQSDLEGMKEIDEFPEITQASDSVADFLMADFDISSGDNAKKAATPGDVIDEFGDDAAVATAAPLPVEEPSAVVEQAMPSAQETLSIEEDEFADSPGVAPVMGEKVQPAVDHSAELAAMMNQITALKKQQQVFKQEMTEKAGREMLANYLEEFDKLQTEQKKNKRAVDALSNQKPIAAYIANGLAVTSLLVGLGLGFQGFIAKSQVAELVPIIAKLQEQGAVPGATDAAEKEMLRKQIDELTVASGVATSQIAELNKALQGDSGSTHGGADFAKQLTELSNQNMQIGDAIESLQAKVSALEKERPAAAKPTPKPEPKKPMVVEQNWAVNLVAFKQDWYATRKAEEFATKGVPAKVVKSETKGETWYRLFVDGFKSQYEAAGYAAKVKKMLNLDSVWVTRIKE